MIAIETLSRAEKLQIMEALWEDLTREEEAFVSPSWHGDVLTATENAYRAGETSFVDWDAAKKALRDGKP